MNKEEIKYILYARKSSESDDRQVQSIEDQNNAMNQLADRLGLKIIGTLEESKSAKKPDNRPIYQNMIQRIKNGEANGILCWHLNRLSRNPVDSGELSWLLQTGILQSIQTVDKEYKPDDNVLLFAVESGSSNQFIIDLKKTSWRGMAGKAERGWLPSRAPLGYLNDKNTNTIIKDTDRHPLVRKMWDLMLTGKYTPEKIVILMNTEYGLTTPKYKNTGGGAVGKTTAYKIFGNLFYTGNFQWNNKIYVGSHEPMITHQEFQEVQNILGRNNRPKYYKHINHYSGLIKCPCGSAITYTNKQKQLSKTKEFKEYEYHHCTKRIQPNCKELRVTDKELNTQIQNKLKDITIAPEFLQWAFETIEENSDLDKQQALLIAENRMKTINRKKQEFNNLRQMRVRDLISDDEFVQDRTKLDQEIKGLENESKAKEDKAEKREELKNWFRFMNELQRRFEKSKEERGFILSKIGNGHILQNQMIDLKMHSWLIPVLTNYKNLETEFTRLELNKTLTVERRNEQIASIRSRWGDYRDLNPN